MVPERRLEVTTEGGLDVAGNLQAITETRKRMNDAGIEVSLFIAPDPAQIDAAARTGSQFIELHTGAFAEAFDREPDAEEKQPVYPRLLIGGIVLMAIYAVLVPVLGFILGTFFFLAAFMYVGGYRAHGALWGTSAVVTIFCGILFLRIAYVSLPRGIPPFDRATDVFFAIPSLW